MAEVQTPVLDTPAVTPGTGGPKKKKKKGMSRGEFDNVKRALGGWQPMLDENAKDKQTLALLQCLVEYQQEDKLFENQQLLKTPIVRNGRAATVGYCPEVWQKWE